MDIDVAIIGAGPAGLAAALALKARGIARVIVLERETEAGGIPRHCGHRTFGLSEFGWPMTGPAYARRLAAKAQAAGIEIRPRTTVTALKPGGELALSDPASGPSTLKARRVLIATGVRETPRSARLIGGSRPLGVLTTGALQNFVYLHKKAPFTRPVIIGTELVSFSSLLTCRHAGIRPLMMIEENGGSTARSSFALYPRLTGIALRYDTKLIAIEGGERVTAVRLADKIGRLETVACDGVLFTGQFVPAAELVRASHLALDPGTGGPVIDQYGRLSDPVFYAAGNVLHPVETSGWCHREGRDIGEIIADDLAGLLPATAGETTITAGPGIKYVVPQRLSPVVRDHALGVLQLRVTNPVNGQLVLASNGERLWSRPVSLRPERRFLQPLAEIARYLGKPGLSLGIEDNRL
jgi:NADPH-dependent 2,4-dienoyl-CoA reductase/sulfur reductase-like enzyme